MTLWAEAAADVENGAAASNLHATVEAGAAAGMTSAAVAADLHHSHERVLVAIDAQLLKPLDLP